MEGMLDAPGARIYYRTRGNGPVVLLLPGGDGDADACDLLAGDLEGEFLVVTYDRRGLSRSRLTGTPADIAAHADDAALVLAAVTDAPALVFGTSIGATIALELTVRHPHLVQRAVIHEPPISGLLPGDLSRQLAEAQLEVEAMHRQAGLPAAMQRFAQLSGFDFADREPDVVVTPPGPARLSNLEFFFTNDAPAVRQYTPDLIALRAVADKLLPAAGVNSSGPVPQCSAALADLLGTQVVEFPGGHNGPTLHPHAFASRLRDLLS